MKEDYFELENAIRRRLMHAERMGEVECEALKRQLSWLESLRKDQSKQNKPNNPQA